MASPSNAASSDATTPPPASVDLYRDTPVRFLGYANELGESFKPLIPRVAYLGTYGVACAYVAADANDKYERDGDVARGVDALIWQALASVIVPGFVVNRVVAAAHGADVLWFGVDSMINRLDDERDRRQTTEPVSYTHLRAHET